nr:protein prune-like protein 2-like isoform X3 [Biomphalaria glabrata]
MGLKEFLVSTKLSQSELQSRLKIHLVLGNESCDLDSTVCAITYAYYLHKNILDAKSLTCEVVKAGPRPCVMGLNTGLKRTDL